MRVQITNYQAHADTTLEFDEPGINVIVGPSDSGKSSIIRAISSLVDASPVDRRHGSRETVVEVDGCRRVRGNTKNQFEIGDRVYKAMRSEAPREIQEKLNLGDINFRSQHQPYFLLADSPGAVARSMNELADLGMIDYVQGELKKMAKAAGDQVSKVDLDIKKHESEITSLSWWVQAEQDWQIYEATVEEATDHNNKATTVEDLVGEALLLMRRLAELPDYSVGVVDQSLSDICFKDIVDFLDELADEGQNLTAWLTGCPPDVSGDMVRALACLDSIVDSTPFQRLVEEAAEYQQDLTLCPDTGADLARIDEALQIPSNPRLEQLLADVARLPARDSFPPEDCLEELETIGAELEMSSRLRDRHYKLTGAVQQASLLHADVKNLVAESGWADMEFKNALKEAEICPLCGGSTK